MSEPVCPKCGRAMERGFTVDHTYGGVLATEWAKGVPETSRWTGIKMRGREHRHIETYRCTNCGYLESYAR